MPLNINDSNNLMKYSSDMNIIEPVIREKNLSLPLSLDGK